MSKRFSPVPRQTKRSTSRPRRRTCFAESLEARSLLAADGLLPISAEAISDGRGADFPGAVAALEELTYGGDDFRELVGRDAPLRGENGDLRDVVVKHIGGDPTNRLGGTLVSGVGTGAQIQLSSWRITQADPAPTHLKDEAPLNGRDLELHVLAPANASLSTRHPFIAGRIGTDNNLWLSSYEVAADGSFTKHDTRGYGSNADVRVLEHAIAQLPSGADDDSSVLVTPLIVENTEGEHEMRIVTWRVNHATGQVVGLKDSGPLSVNNLPNEVGTLTIHHSFAGIFEVNYKSGSDRLATRYIAVADNGLVLDAAGGDSGQNYQGGTNNYYVDAYATASLNNESFFAISQQGSDVEATVWERRVEGCLLFLCAFEPYELGNSENDDSPHALGVSFPLPDLTHAYSTTPGSNEFFGTSVAAGDFNGDGFQDVAVGAPGQSVNGKANAGAVTLIYGNGNGLYNSPLGRTIHQGTDGLQGAVDANDRFGQTVVSADFNGDGIDDLAIAAPGESIEGEGLTEVGVVHILFGSDNGITTAGDQILRQGTDGVAGISESGDQFGFALTAGDYNGDGRSDLTVGIPFEDHNGPGYVDGGAVHVFYGSGTGLRTDNDITFHLDSTAMVGSAAANDQYGYSLASGDINNDGRDDLAVGVPGKQFFGMDNAGAVHVVMGSLTGLGTLDQLISQDGIQAGFAGAASGDISDSTEAGDRFGQAVAMGDFDGDGFDDLAISAPEEDLEGPTIVNAGKVHVLQGSAQGITPTNEKLFHQDSPSIPSAAETGSRFGYTLTTGEVHGDGYKDLLIGVPHQDDEAGGNITYANAGIVILLKGSSSSILTFSGEMLRQGVGGIDDEPGPGDHFGEALVMADFNQDGLDDAVIGVPNETATKLSSEYNNGGAIHLVFADGDGSGLSTSDQFRIQGETKHIRARMADSGWEAQYGVGNGTVYELMPPGPVLPEHAASVTKTMTLLLAVEALGQPNSSVSLSDIVTISEKAGTTGGSKMSGTQDGEDVLLEPGDQITLEALLYGMVIPSGNRASVAIAEHIAVNVYGANANDEDDPFNVFVDHMNQRATEIGLNDTRYGHPAGGSTTTPQDLITFWREAWQNADFRTYAGANSAYPNNPAMTINGDPPKEFNLARNGTYVGHDGYKGGHGKVGDVYDAQGQIINAPICDQCHVGSATRAGHRLVVGIQQSGDDTTNARRLYDFGFQQLFTPDLRGTNDYQNGGPIIVNPGDVIMGDLKAIDLDHVTGNWIVSAGIDANRHLQLQSWSTNAQSGHIQIAGGTAVAMDHLAPATGEAGAMVVMDVVELPSTGRVLGDYVSGMIADGNLRLDTWRVGAEYVEPVVVPPPTGIVGDFTGNGSVGEEDIEFLSDQIDRQTTELKFDLDGNRQVNRDDLRYLITRVLHSNLGDANLDGVFNSTDLVEVFRAGKYEDGILGNATWREGDWNQDGDFDTGDLVAAFAAGTYSTAAVPILSAVPTVLGDLSDDELFDQSKLELAVSRPADPFGPIPLSLYSPVAASDLSNGTDEDDTDNGRRDRRRSLLDLAFADIGDEPWLS